MPLTGARPEVAVVVAMAAPFAGRVRDERTAVPRWAPDAGAPSSGERVLDADPGDRLAMLEILAQEANSTQPRSRDESAAWRVDDPEGEGPAAAQPARTSTIGKMGTWVLDGRPPTGIPRETSWRYAGLTMYGNLTGKTFRRPAVRDRLEER